jgi:hypothetical protein
MRQISVGLWLCAAFVLWASGAVAADWVSTGGPVGGLGYDVRIDPRSKQTMFVTDNYAGIVKSTNGGSSWVAANAGITVRAGPTGDAFPIFSLTIDPNNPDILWAGTNGADRAFGIFKSIDGGTNWQSKNSGINDNGFGIVFRGFTIQPASSNVVYAQAEIPTASQGREFNRVEGRVYKTIDGGESWSLVWSGDNLARYLIVDPTNSSTLYLSTGIFDREARNSTCELGVSGAGGVGILKSTNGGASWSPINDGLTDLYVGALRMHPSNAQVLFAATGNNACSGGYEGNVVSGLFRTTNAGASWQEVIAGDIFTSVAFSPSSPNVVYAGSARAFYRSEDSGATWSQFAKASGWEWGPPGIRAGVPIDVTVDPDDPNVLFANNYGGGVFRSLDGARTWEVWSRGYSGAEIHSLAVADARAGTVYAIGRSGPFRSPNYGVEWIGIGNGAATFPEWYAVAAQPTSSDVVLISDEHQGVILRSSDAGDDFVEVLRHPDADAADPRRRQGFKAIAFAPSDPSVVYAGAAKERGTIDASVPAGRTLYRSIDGGATFTSPTAALDGRNIHRLVVDGSNADVVWAATSEGAYKTTDGGVTWAPAGLKNKDVIAVAVDPSDANAVVASVRDVGIFVSADGGATWPGGPFNAGFTNPNPRIVALIFDPAAPGLLYAADFYSGVYSSTDGGKSWSGFPNSSMTGLAMRSVKDLALAGGVLYAATAGGGVFRNGGPSIVLTPSEASFGAVEVAASSAPQTVTVFNAGPTARFLSGTNLTGAHASDFRIENNSCLETLGVSESCTFEIRFTPSAVGVKSAMANVVSDDPFAPTSSMLLSGTAVESAADAGTVPDASSAADAGTTQEPDGGAGGDGSSTGGHRSSGCGCRAGGGENGQAWVLLVLGTAVLFFSRRPNRSSS